MLFRSKTYQKLREHGESKTKSARIANAAAGSSRRKVAAKGGIKGRSSMSKGELINALRNH